MISDSADSGPSFMPTTEFQLGEGRRDIALCFVGNSLVAGYGDPKALGWVARVLARTPHRDVDLTAYNLGVRGQSSADMLSRWRSETAVRWDGRNERRLVLGFGAADLSSGLTTARSRLNLANILDDAATNGIASFVVGPPPVLDADTNERLGTLSEAMSDVCSRRGVTYVDCFRPLLGHEQWQSDLAAGDGTHPGQTGYGLLAWLVLHAGWLRWLELEG